LKEKFDSEPVGPGESDVLIAAVTIGNVTINERARSEIA
jgi:hypothetical protein